jgi:hypothetical protein
MTRRRRALASALTFLVVLLVGAGTTAAAARAPSVASLIIANVGPGYTVTSQGPLNPGQIASSSPDPSAAAGAFNALSGSITTYQRAWQDAAMNNQVQDLVVHFDSTAAAQAFEKAAQQALTSGEIVSSGPVASLPGALRTTYFATTTQVGVGQAITVRRGAYVVLLSMFSANSPTNTTPISPASALTVAQAQYAALAKAVAKSPHRAATPTSHRSVAAEVVIAVALIGLYALWARRSRRRPARPVDPGALEADADPN